MLIDECPNWIEAGNRLQEALSLTDNEGVDLALRLLHTTEDAASVLFAGLPTIVLDGADLFPSDGRTTHLACRIYVTPSGVPDLPATAQLVEAIMSRAPCAVRRAGRCRPVCLCARGASLFDPAELAAGERVAPSRRRCCRSAAPPAAIYRLNRVV